MTTPDLKPCPFCGEKAISGHFPLENFIVECGNSYCRVLPLIAMKWGEEEAAITAWNTRAENDKQEPAK